MYMYVCLKEISKFTLNQNIKIYWQIINYLNVMIIEYLKFSTNVQNSCYTVIDVLIDQTRVIAIEVHLSCEVCQGR